MFPGRFIISANHKFFVVLDTFKAKGELKILKNHLLFRPAVAEIYHLRAVIQAYQLSSFFWLLAYWITLDHGMLY